MKPVLSSFFVLFDMTEFGVEPEHEYVLHYRVHLRHYMKHTDTDCAECLL